MIPKSPILWFVIILVLIAVVTSFGPAEATLGINARVVYLHGAWVWASLFAFIAAGIAGLVGLIQHGKRQDALSMHTWSRSLGRAGQFFWITYLPISLWAMESNWNGLFLSEPRWRMAAIFAIAGVLLQLGLSFLPVSWASFWNLAYVITLFIVLRVTENVMHPPSPMLQSDAWRIQSFFGGLTILLILATWQVARWFKSLEH